MEPDAIAEARELAERIARLLHGAVDLAVGEHQHAEIRYAEALAQTLCDQLATVRGGPSPSGPALHTTNGTTNGRARHP